MKFNPRIHHRRSIRLQGYDYSQAGLYFITICCQHMFCRFGTIRNREMILNEFGQIAYDNWLALPDRFLNMALDVFQIMPNHMHGIIHLNDADAAVGAGLAPAQNAPAQNAEVEIERNRDDHATNAEMSWTGASPAPTVGNIVGAYKSLVANECLEIFKTKNKMMGKLWQRNYYEHIIRNEPSYKNISVYIINNPAKWKDDKFYEQ